MDIIPGNEKGVITSYSIHYTKLYDKLSDKMQEIYKNFGIDLPAANGDLSFELPIPATYVVAANNIISYAFIDADYTNRLDPEIIIRNNFV